MPLIITQKPNAPVIDIDELKDHLNMQGVDRFDDYLLALIKAIPEPAARAKGQTLIKTEYRWSIRSWGQKIEMPRPPLIAVSKVEYRNDAGDWTEVDGAHYETNIAAKPGFVRFLNDYSMPATCENEEYPWRFTYTAGYTDEDGNSTFKEVPDNLRLWVKNLIGSQFMKREADMISNGSIDVQYLEKAMARLTRGENYNRHFG